MTLRRTAPLVLALLACQADLDRRPLSTIDYAVFDPSSSRIPLPNDLALQSAATMPAGAQKELLGQFIAAGGFPNDQEMPITIQLTRATVDAGAGGAIVYEAPELDLETVTAETVALLEVSATGAVPVPFEASYAKNADGQRGTLTLRRPVTNGTRRWTAGAQVVVALRGGADGVKFVGSADGIQPQPTFYVVREAALGNKDLTQRENQALLPGTKEQKAAAGAQLDALRKAYLQPLQLVDQVGGVPAEDVAVLATFKIAPSAGVAVAVDAGSGIVPLPIDLLRNPDANGKPGTVVNNAAFGPAAAGLATLDGFSTTATILAQTTGVIDADTVTGETVKLFKLDGEGGATLVPTVSATEPSPRYVTQPPVLNQACPVGSCSTVIGLQPAVPVPVGAGVLALPPLEEGTDYAVVITKGVLDVAQKPLVKSTFAKILLDVQAPVVVDGKSTLSGVADDTAKQIAMIKAKLAPALEQVTAADVVMAYTFRTQSITGTALQLSAAVYDPAGAAFFAATEPVPEPLLTGTTLPPSVEAMWRTTIPTLDAINPANGALQPDTTQWDVAGIPALV
ncbi:MAG TPA: hypothetical protein VD838_08885, partial [Anaeromyxobacteraceae bacterium]|nr:hypothetical protein [Anaeromyxobacteraceae bacterium]